MNYADALTWLYGMQLHGVKLGLRNVRRLVRALRVHVDGEGEPWYVHVAGTNGKGSVCAMLDSILRAAGRSTGLFTSPHLVDFRERIRHGGKMIPEAELAVRITNVRDLVKDWDDQPTFFEITTALALSWFQEVGTEVAVLEAGMGGRFDATNVVTPAVSVITSIALDHQKFLGNTLPEITLEKAGIIKQAVPVISAPQEEEVRAVLGQIARHRESPISFVVSPLEGIPIALAGQHQRWNAALAVHALQLTKLRVPDEAVVQGLAGVRWPGRFEEIAPGILVDGAHNPAAAEQAAETWRVAFPAEKATLILGVLGDKDLRGICRALLPLARRVIVAPVRSERSSTVQELCACCRELAPDLECTKEPNFAASLSSAQDYPEKILITGSLFLVGEAIAQVQQLSPPVASAQ